jgi:hypothetical protein
MEKRKERKRKRNRDWQLLLLTLREGYTWVHGAHLFTLALEPQTQHLKSLDRIYFDFPPPPLTCTWKGCVLG